MRVHKVAGRRFQLLWSSLRLIFGSESLIAMQSAVHMPLNAVCAMNGLKAFREKTQAARQ